MTKPNRSGPTASIEVLPRPEVSDTEFVVRARGGDRWAEEALFRRHVRAVVATATRLLGDPDEAQDIVQETFALAFEELARLRDAPAFKSWLLRIAVSRVHRVFRRQRLLRAIGLSRAEQSGSLAALASQEAGPEVHVELTLLDRELQRVPSEERLAWMLRYVEGLELSEVADACDCSLATAKRRIGAADARVRRHAGLGGIDER